MKIKYFFKVRVGKETSQLTVEYEGYGGDKFAFTDSKAIKIQGFFEDKFKVDENKSCKKWPMYIDCTINEDGLQVEYKGQIKKIDVKTHINHCTGFIDIISFEAYK